MTTVSRRGFLGFIALPLIPVVGPHMLISERPAYLGWRRSLENAFHTEYTIKDGCRWPYCHGGCCLPELAMGRMRWREGDRIVEADVATGLRKMRKIEGDLKGVGWQEAYDSRDFQIGPHFPESLDGDFRVRYD